VKFGLIRDGNTSGRHGRRHLIRLAFLFNGQHFTLNPFLRTSPNSQSPGKPKNFPSSRRVEHFARIWEEHFTSYSQGQGASLAATAERLGTGHFPDKEKGYGTVKFNTSQKSKMS
jgi:hypothetical protein